jgi:hypothetical protein
MDYNELLERWERGQTTLDEERALREHLAAGGGPEWARAVFGHFDRAAEWTAADVGPRKRLIFSCKAVMRWAAAVVLALCLGQTDAHRPTVYAWVDGRPVTDVEVALDYARSALGVMDANLARTQQYLAPIGRLDQPMQYLRFL